MKPRSLRAVLSFRIALLTAAVVIAIGTAGNFMITSRFKSYMAVRRKSDADRIAGNVSRQYDAISGGWNIDYIHGMGMYALNDGYIISLQDKEGRTIWDAENHDMTSCHEPMHPFFILMKKARPELQRKFMTQHYELKHNGQVSGYLDVSYYGPNFMRENDFRFVSALDSLLVTSGIIALIAAVTVSVFMAGKIAGPVAETVRITRKISEGDYSIRLSGNSYTKEIHELVQAVNHMATSLEEQEILRRRLTSDIAHELRTPIANLSSYLEMMLEEVWQPTPERLKDCYDELHRLSAIISDIDKLRQAEDANFVLSKSLTDLLDLAKGTVKGFASSIHEHRINCTVEGEASEVCADPGRVRQVIANLLSNAIKYSGDGGRVKVSVTDAEECGIITVEDDGIGIPSEDLGRIFERFYRTDRSRTRRTGGAGIGLTIARAIVRAHGGSIEAESGGSRGSKFTVTFPK